MAKKTDSYLVGLAKTLAIFWGIIAGLYGLWRLISWSWDQSVGYTLLGIAIVLVTGIVILNYSEWYENNHPGGS